MFIYDSLQPAKGVEHLNSEASGQASDQLATKWQHCYHSAIDDVKAMHDKAKWVATALTECVTLKTAAYLVILPAMAKFFSLDLWSSWQALR